MKKRYFLFLIVVMSIFTSGFITIMPDWGFFAHKKINRMAVYILPPEMMVFFKGNIDYISEHAPDPDKRRYTSTHEAIRHYMDLDHWGAFPYVDTPRRWDDAICKYLELYLIQEGGDTILLFSPELNRFENDSLHAAESKAILYQDYRQFVKKHVLPDFDDKPWNFDIDSLNSWLNLNLDSILFISAYATERFTAYGILPYHIKQQYYRLVKAFENKDFHQILKISTDLGHYIADAHVPLHTSENYNGQMTGQDGIHAFWESRLPELFANESYNYFVGKAQYISDIQKMIWQTILVSNQLSNEVLKAEKKIRSGFPDDQQFTFDVRLETPVRIQSRAYSKAFQDAMNGMVERRMQDAVLAIGSIWFSAWVDAGQPILGEAPDIQWSEGDIQEREVYSKNYNIRIEK